MSRPTGSRSKVWRLLAAVLALALVAAACADDDSTGGGDGNDEPAVDATAALGEANPAEGEPVKVGLISASEADSPLAAQFQRVEAGMNAAVEYANEYRAGLGGRPIELFICQGGETPAGSQDCANQMVNEGVVAVAMPFTANGASMVPIITGGGIPYFALSGASAEELTGDGAFMITGGFPATLAAYASHAADAGLAKMAFLATNGPGVIEGINALGGIAFANAGVELEVIPTPVGTADMTPQLQSAVDGGAEAIGMVGDLTFCSSFFQSYQTLAVEEPRYLIGPCIDPTTVEAYGDVIEGSIISGASSNDPDSPDAQLFAAIAQTYGDFAGDRTASNGELAGMVPLLTLVNVMDGHTGDVDAASVMAAIGAGVDVEIWGGDGSTFTCDGSAIPMLKNICSSDVYVGVADAEGQLQDPEQIDVGPLFGG
jgi:branched-chain amino acid transport system substrate-binding protein